MKGTSLLLDSAVVVVVVVVRKNDFMEPSSCNVLPGKMHHRYEFSAFGPFSPEHGCIS